MAPAPAGATRLRCVFLAREHGKFLGLANGFAQTFLARFAPRDLLDFTLCRAQELLSPKVTLDRSAPKIADEMPKNACDRGGMAE